MKKTVLMVIYGLLVYGQTFAQSEPIMGYDKVKWGASVLDVRKAYNLGNSVPLQENYGNQDVNVAALEQKNVSDSIKQRTFMFNKWKGNYQLYRVWVIYWDDSTVQNLLTGLTSRFGESTDIDRDSEGGGVALIVRDTLTFGKYAPELVVELFHTYGSGAFMTDANGNFMGNLGRTVSDPLQVCYTWKKFRDEYQSRNVEF